MMKYLQKLGKSLMLPVAVLPAAAILVGIGNALAGMELVPVLANFLKQSGGAILDNLPILFAIGVALGMTKTQDGAAALSGLVAFKIITTLLASKGVAQLSGVEIEDVHMAFGNIDNAFIGIISGLVAAECYNRFSGVQLPQFLAFFSGKRCVPIITAAAMLIVSGILFFIWPVVYSALVAFGTSIKDLGPLGAGIYGFFNRLLIPTGLHHALNQVFWQNLANINDIGNFWNPSAELIASGGIVGNYRVGMYQAGFFPVMMFGLPGGALAMYHTAKDNKKKVAASLLLAAAFSSFFTGITEPLEFSFMFLAPGLYVVHAVLMGVSVFLAATFNWIAGFSFSAGLVDFLLSLGMPLANKPYMLIVLGLVMFVLYYVIFRFLIVKFNLKTPGREDDDEVATEKTSSEGNDYTKKAQIILEGLGGKENLTSIDNCITRLRLEVKDISKVDDKKIKSAGITGVIRPGKNSVQVIVGTQVQFVADELKKL